MEYRIKLSPGTNLQRFKREANVGRVVIGASDERLGAQDDCVSLLIGKCFPGVPHSVRMRVCRSYPSERGDSLNDLAIADIYEGISPNRG